LIGIVVMAALVSSVMPQRFWDRMATITASSEELDASARGRLHFWEVATAMANAKPFTGVGFNGFERSYTAYDRTKDFGEDRSVHSVWFGLLSELGYPGLLLFVVILLSGIWSCRQVRRCKATLTVGAGPLLTGFSTSFVVFAAGGTFLPAQYNRCLALCRHGLACTPSRPEKSEREVTAQRSTEMQPVSKHEEHTVSRASRS
jgi:O-antigen ligase